MRWVFLAALGCLFACEEQKTATPVVEVAPAAAPVPAPVAPPEPDPPKEVIVSTTVATFRQEKLDECVDLVAALPPDATDEETEGLRERFLEKMKASASGVKLVPTRKLCAEQFTDRTPVATCIVPEQKMPFRETGEARLILASTYYRAETARKDDTFMRQCLEMGGDWKEHGPANPQGERLESLRHRLMRESEGR